MGELQKIPGGGSSLTKGFEFDSSVGLLALKEIAQEIIDSGLCPKNLTEPGQLLAIGQLGKEVGFSWMASINNIDNINGKPTLSYRAVGALLHMNNYGVNWLKDCEAVNLIDGTQDFITEVEIVDFNLLEKYKKELEKILSYPEDIRAMFLAALNETFSQVKRRMSYKWSDATAAGYAGKSQWQKMPREMMRARCLTAAVRALCPHVMMGLYETTEIDPNATLTKDDGFEYAEQVD